jgi:VIT1/CCC1 family predicted Fe2+/Mn2+ transporter
MLIGALGCNLAWAIIDAVFYLMGSFNESGQGILKLKALRQARNADDAHQMLAHALPPVIASVLSDAELETMRQKLSRLPEPPQRPYLQKQDWLGAFAVFLVIAVATLPVVMPFALIEDAKRALRVSNGLAVLMLFLTGYAFGRSAGHRPFAMAFTMVIMGAALVAITISLGG